MLPRTSIHGKYGFGILIICLLVVSFSFAYGGKEGGPFRSFQQVQATSSFFRDSIPPKTRPAGSTLDNRSVLDKELNEQAIEQALKNVEYSLKKLEAELRNKDWSQVEKNTRYALADVNKRLLSENDIHLDQLKIQLNNARVIANQQLKQMQFNIDHHLKINLQNATHGLQKTGVSLQQLKAFMNDLENDGLIEKGKPCSVEIKNGNLYINDVKQPRRVNKKYRKKYKTYVEKEGGFKLQLNGAGRYKDEGELI
ncbi:hypothetical protein [Agriterribacter sp.]|uniref:hypothetical protein n=1 Tax=Agriterribacter sp. TaxID=2821509 RepID=UPI002C32DBE8|nr:hypothetical protein [Agriterribacter sp.]HTN07292.1 hypothetical protein [Agriterribacter sp.]